VIFWNFACERKCQNLFASSYHDQPGPRVKISVVDTLEDQPDETEPEQNDDESESVFLELFDVRVHRDGQQGHVLADKDDVKKQLADQGRHMLQRNNCYLIENFEKNYFCILGYNLELSLNSKHSLRLTLGSFLLQLFLFLFHWNIKKRLSHIY